MCLLAVPIQHLSSTVGRSAPVEAGDDKYRREKHGCDAPTCAPEPAHRGVEHKAEIIGKSPHPVDPHEYKSLEGGHAQDPQAAPVRVHQVEHKLAGERDAWEAGKQARSYFCPVPRSGERLPEQETGGASEEAHLGLVASHEREGVVEPDEYGLKRGKL